VVVRCRQRVFVLEETAAKAHGLPHGGRTNLGFSHFEPIFLLLLLLKEEGEE